MKIKRLILRKLLVLEKIVIKIKNLDLKELAESLVAVGNNLQTITHLRNLVLFSVVFFCAVSFMFLTAFASLPQYYTYKKPLEGGRYSEGMVGKFLRLNPLYSPSNPVDEEAVHFIYSGLMKRDADRRIVPDMADQWQLSSDKKKYSFTLKKGIYWHDGVALTPDDIAFTVKLIQNPDVRSGYYGAWKGVKVMTGPDKVTFALNEPNEAFIEALTLGILPQHLLARVNPRDVQTFDFNNQPVGTGPYKFKTLQKGMDKDSLLLIKNDRYYAKKPFLREVELIAYKQKDYLISAYDKQKI